MKIFQRILSIFLILMTALGVLAPTAQAAGMNVRIEMAGAYVGYFDFWDANAMAWQPLPQPHWRIAGDNSPAFCLQSNAVSPHDNFYDQVSPETLANVNIINGVKAILLNGYPNSYGWVDGGEAHYATQIAIWSWMYEQAGIGHEFYHRARLRASEPKRAECYNFYLYLLECAANNVQTAGFGVRVEPSVVTMAENGANLVGTATVHFQNANGEYTIDDSKLPLLSGITVTGSTFRDGDTLTITAPNGYLGQTVDLDGVIVGSSLHNPANIFWYSSPNLQDMVAYDMSMQGAARANFSFTSAPLRNALRIVKKTSDGSSPAGFQFQVWLGDTVNYGTHTTDAAGIIELPNLRPETYIVKEVNIPDGWWPDGPNPKQVVVENGKTTTVEFTNIWQLGKIIVQKVNADPASGDHSLAGAVFEIIDMAGNVVDTVTTGADGRAEAKNRYFSNYTVREKTAPAGFLRNTATFPVTVTSVNTVATVTVPESPQMGRITVRKTNANPDLGGGSLAGAVFEILDAQGKIVDTVTTNGNGTAQSKALKLGDYTVVEKQAPTGFVRNSAVFNASLAYAGQDVQLATASVTVPEQPQAGVIHLNKTNADAVSGDYSLQGAVFEIRDSQGKLVDTVTTNAQGQADSKQLPLGNYSVTEKTAPHGFLRDKNEYDANLVYAGQDVAVATTTVNVPEKPQTGKISIKKTNANPTLGDYSLAGAVFEIYSGATLVDTITTDAAGNAQSKALKLGSYTVKEKTAPNGYVRNTSDFPAKLEYAGQDVEIAVATVTVPEQPQAGKISVKKTNANPALGNYPLNGAVFEILDGQGKVVDTITTDVAGNTQSKALKLGSYTVKEKTAPTSFVRNTTSFPANLVYAGQDLELAVATVTVPEQPQAGMIRVTKSNAKPEMGSDSLANAVFEILDSKGVVVDTITTDAQGKANSKQLPLGNYSVTEKTAPHGFLRDKNEYDANLVYAGQDVAVATTTVNVPEKPQVGKINLTKTNADKALGDYSLAGAVFEIYSGTTLVDTVTTNAQGEAQSKTLKLGSYTVKEKTAPNGYVLNTTSFPAKLEYAGQDVEIAVATVTVPEQPQAGVIRVTKSNANPEMGSDSLANAVFEILDSKGVVVDTITTDAQGKANSKQLPLGNYTIREKTAPNGFVLNTATFPAKLEYAGQDVEIAVATVTVSEQPQAGVIHLNKTNADAVSGDYSLAGAVFEIRDSQGKLVDTVTTDAKGQADSKQLPLGNYSVTEKTAPHGFLRDKNEYEANLVYAGQEVAVATVTVNVPEKPQTGKISIKKSNANPALGDYPLSGAVFEIFDGQGKVVDTITTDAAGTAQSKALKLGDYTVREKTAPHGYVLNTATFPANLEYAGQDVELAVASVTVPEQPQTGVVRVTKSNANPAIGDYSLSGAVFEILDSQGKVVDTIITNEQGKAQSKELPLGSYTVAEKMAPHGFVRNQNTFGALLEYAGQEISVQYVDVVVAEQPQVGTITVAKRDSVASSTAQGDAELTGAVFEVFASDKTTLVDTIYCGAGVTATTKKLPLGTYYVREKTPPLGYNLDDAFHEVKLEYAGQDVEVTSASYDLKNKVIQGQIAITKHTDLPAEGYDDDQNERPLEGAIFHVWLKSAGSYDKAKESERDEITTDADGNALSKVLPYGLYVVEEISAPGDVLLVEPFEVFIAQEGKIYRFILSDPAFRSPVRIVKVDAESGKPIALAGTTFKIRSLATGKFVTQHASYPAPAEISESETGADGTLMLPEPLKSGEYELVEVQAPRGYLLSKEPVRFFVHSDQEDEIVTVKMANKAVMGKVSVEKTGHMLVGAKEIETVFGKQYLPIFELGHLVGAEFDVVAAEDIVTGDGIVHVKKGDVVDHIVTDESGLALSKELHLGEYALVETKAPASFVLDATPHAISLTYENQEIAVVTSQIGVQNARQTVEISLTKIMEGEDKFAHFEDVIFGLYTAEDIYAEDGTLLIAKDSLILAQDSLLSLAALDENGFGHFDGELPFAKYYVRELQTAEGFVLDATKYPVEAKYSGAEHTVTKIAVNGGEAIINKRATGELRVLKLDAQSHEPLAGAKFGLYQGETLIGEAVTDEKGYAQFSDLPCGEYQVRELEAPVGYVLVDEIYTVFIHENGQRILLEVLNQKKPGEPEKPDEPDAPDVPDQPEIPETPDKPDMPTEPETPDAPDVPATPETPEEPENPVAPPADLPKTGDAITPGFLIGIGAIALGAALGAVFLLLKKRREDDENE